MTLLRSRTKNLLLIFVFLVLGLGTFSHSLSYPFTDLDDDEYVFENGDIRRMQLENIKRWFSREYVLNFIPVTMASFALDYQIWKLNPFGFRLTNVILHCANAFLIYLIIAALTGSGLIAFLTALLFIIHPVQIESVVWITERKNTLSTFFALFSLLQYTKGKLKTCGVFFLLSLLSKPSTVVMPVIFLLHDVLVGKPGSMKKRLMFNGVLVLFALAVGVITLGLHVETEIYFRGGSFLKNLYVMSVVFFRYLQLLLHPFHQSIMYMTEVYDSPLRLPVLLSFSGIAAIFVLLGYSFKRHPKICFLACWYLIFLLPVSNVVTPISTIMNDRYLYVPCVGLFALGLLAVQSALRHLKLNPIACSVLVVTFCLIYAAPVFALQQLRMVQWKSSVDLWQTDLLKARYKDPRLNYFLGTSEFKKGNVNESIAQLKELMKLPFVYERDILMLSQSYLFQQQPDNAYEFLKLVKPDTDSYLAYVYQDLMAQYHEQKGNYKEAERYYIKSIAAKPKIPSFLHLANFYSEEGRLEEAIQTLEKGLREVDPDSKPALVNLCSYYLKRHDFSNAYNIYLKLVSLYPEDAYVQQIASQMKRFSASQHLN